MIRPAPQRPLHAGLQRPRAREGARRLPADALILDLEDAVAPDAKDDAREQVCAAVAGRRLRPARARHPRQRARHALGRGRPRRRRCGRARRDPDAEGLRRRRHLQRGATRCAGRRARRDAALGDDRDAARHPQHRRHRQRGAPTRLAARPASSWARTTSPRRRAPRLVPGRAPMLPWLSRRRRRRAAPTASTSSTASTTTSPTRRRLPRRMRAGPRPRLRRQDR